MSVIIRTVCREDYSQWLPLWAGYNAFYGRSGATALNDTINQITWQRFFNESDPLYALVAEEAGQLMGLTHFLYHHATITIAPVCYLSDLFILPQARGKGVARALIEAVYEQAAADGAARVYWQTHESNMTAQRLYDRIAEKSGFIVYRHFLA